MPYTLYGRRDAVISAATDTLYPKVYRDSLQAEESLCGCGRAAHLFEADDVRVHQQSVIQHLPLNVHGDLRATPGL